MPLQEHHVVKKFLPEKGNTLPDTARCDPTWRDHESDDNNYNSMFVKRRAPWGFFITGENFPVEIIVYD